MKRVFELIFLLAISCLSTFVVGCDKISEPTVNPQVLYGENLYYSTQQTLQDVSIVLSEHDTNGTIGWAKPDSVIGLGVNEYEWKFVPANSNYTELSGIIEVMGCKLLTCDIKAMNCAYTGEDLKEEIVAKLNQEFGEDCMVSMDSSVTVKASGEYKLNFCLTAKEYRYLIVDGEHVKEATFELDLVVGNNLPVFAYVEEAEYTGEEQTFSINAEGCIEGRDYELEYWEENSNVKLDRLINAGSYQVVIKGIGKYYGERTCTYTIQKADFNSKSFNEIGDVVYNGTSQKPEVYVKGVKPTDYTLTSYYKSFGADKFEKLDEEKNNYVEAGVYKFVAISSDNFEASEIYTSFSIGKATNELIDFKLTDVEYGSSKDSVLATAKAGKVSVKYYSDALATEEISTPEDVGKYYVRVIVTDNNYLDYVSEIKSFEITPTTAIVLNEAQLTEVNSINYCKIEISGRWAVDGTITVEKETKIQADASLTINGELTFEQSVKVEGDLITTKQGKLICMNSLEVIGNIQNIGNIECYVNNLSELENGIRYANKVCVNQDIREIGQKEIKINAERDIKCIIEMNNKSICNVSMILTNIQNETNAIEITIRNKSLGKAKISGENILKIEGNEKVSIRLEKLCLEASKGPALLSRKGGVKLVIEECEIETNNTDKAIILEEVKICEITRSRIRGGIGIEIKSGELICRETTIEDEEDGASIQIRNGEETSSIKVTVDSKELGLRIRYMEEGAKNLAEIKLENVNEEEYQEERDESRMDGYFYCFVFDC